MAYNTGNPIGSTSPKDLSDNARNLDLLLLGDDPSYPDRKGVPRKSWKGMEAEYVADRLRRATEFHMAQTEREAQFKAFMDASGYEAPVPYAPGLTLERATQTVTFLGNEYRVKSQFLPLTTIDWATDQSKLKLIGDDSLRQALADPIDPGNGVGMLGYMGRSLADHLGDYINAKDHGMRAVPGFDNRKALQKAINKGVELGLPVRIPGAKLPYEIWGTVWKPSRTFLYGDGGKNKLTQLKAMDGHYTDLLVAGEHDEGVNHKEIGRGLLHRNGFPYLSTNIGHDIGIRGIYIDGNGDNAGYAPELGPSTQYRGCNVLIRFVDGVFVDDLHSEYAPNDCLYISRCRRQWIQNCELHRNRLPGFTGRRADSTRNLLTCAGTLGWRPEFGDRSDYFVIQNIQAEDSEDLGVCIQFIQEPGVQAVISGPVIIRDITTKRCATYGTAIEISGTGENQNERDCVIISGITSIGDSWLAPLASILISQNSISVIASDLIIKDAAARGLLCEGSRSLTIGRVIVDGWGKVARAAGIYVPAIHIYSKTVNYGKNVNLSDFDVRNPGVGDTGGIEVSGFDICHAVNLHVEETTYESKTDSAGIHLACLRNYGTNLTTNGTACNGIRVSGHVDFGLFNCHPRNSGRSLVGQAIGINIAADGLKIRRGRIIGCSANDDQVTPTQRIGILLHASAIDVVLVTGCDAAGNIEAPLVNLGMPKARIHANVFDYLGETMPMNTGGNGGFRNGLKIGSYTIWVEPATGKMRMKVNPTSDSDGVVVGSQV